MTPLYICRQCRTPWWGDDLVFNELGIAISTCCKSWCEITTEEDYSANRARSQEKFNGFLLEQSRHQEEPRRQLINRIREQEQTIDLLKKAHEEDQEKINRLIEMVFMPKVGEK